MIQGSFKKQTTLGHRQEESSRMKEKYPDRIPVIIEQSTGCVLPPIDKRKYLVPHDLTIYHLQYIVRKRLKVRDHETMFLFCEGALLRTDQYISNVYKHKVDQDGFLYLTYSQENAFGSEESGV
jgi:GABA(A) receptor-associated protein